MRTFQQFNSEVKTPSLANDLRTSLDCCQWNISLLTHRWWPPMANLCGLHKTSWVGKKTKWRERHLHGPEIGSLLNCPDHNPDIRTGHFLYHLLGILKKLHLICHRMQFKAWTSESANSRTILQCSDSLTQNQKVLTLPRNRWFCVGGCLNFVKGWGGDEDMTRLAGAEIWYSWGWPKSRS